MSFFQEDMAHICREAKRRWGVDAQLFQTAEEVGELLVALNKWRRSNNLLQRPQATQGSFRNQEVLEEAADVLIMLCQVVEMFDADHQDFEAILDTKLRRLAETLGVPNV